MLDAETYSRVITINLIAGAVISIIVCIFSFTDLISRRGLKNGLYTKKYVAIVIIYMISCPLFYFILFLILWNKSNEPTEFCCFATIFYCAIMGILLDRYNRKTGYEKRSHDNYFNHQKYKWGEKIIDKKENNN